jgi:hypothetical protein
MDTISGRNLRELQPDERRKYGLSSGIKVTGPQHAGELRWNRNIVPGFIISTVNGEAITGISNFKRLLKTSQGLFIGGMYSDGIHETYYID